MAQLYRSNRRKLRSCHPRTAVHHTVHRSGATGQPGRFTEGFSLRRLHLINIAAFEHVQRFGEVYDHPTGTELKSVFVFKGERTALIDPQRGIFTPQQMRFPLSIKTVLLKLGGKV